MHNEEVCIYLCATFVRQVYTINWQTQCNKGSDTLASIIYNDTKLSTEWNNGTCNQTVKSTVITFVGGKFTMQVYSLESTTESVRFIVIQP